MNKNGAKWALLTWNNPPVDCWLKASQAGVTWIIGQKEIGTSGTLHCQFVAYNEKAMVKRTWIEKFPGCHVATKRACAAKDIIAYVQKSDSAVADSQFEWGKKPNLSAKHEGEKYDDTLDCVKKMSWRDAPAEHQVKYIRNLLLLEGLYSTTADKSDVRGTWIYGVSGTGKSTEARRLAGDSKFYAKQQNKWWDGYRGEKVVILDDFDKLGTGLSHYIKIWADKFAFQGEVKGGFTLPDFERFIVTSNYLPEDLWPGETDVIESIRRRFIFVHLTHRWIPQPMVQGERSVFESALNRFIGRFEI